MSGLPEKMLAVINRGPHDYKLETVDCPRPGPKEAVAKVESTGICGSDVHCCGGAASYWGGANPWVKTPVIPGHEFVCRIVALGEGAEEHLGVKVGDRVIAEQILPCGKCRFCKSGKYWMCDVHNMYGFQSEIANGSFAEYMKIYSNSVIHKIPEELSIEDAGIIEPMACALHAVQRAQIDFADVIVLAGAGPLGLGMIQGIKLKTPKLSIVIDLDDKRLALAKELGADMTINPTKEDAIAKVKSLTDGYGCDIYIEATGSPVGVNQGLAMIRRLGRFVQFSVHGKETSSDWSVIGDKKELDLLGSHLGPYCYESVINLMQRGLLTSKGIVTHKFPLKDFEEAMKTASTPGAGIKILMIP